MAIRIRDLKQKFPGVPIYGPEDAAVFRLASWDAQNINEETLYIAPPETLPPEQQNVNLAVIPDTIRETTVEQIQEILRRDHQRSADLLALYAAAEDGCSGDQLVLLCRKIMDNPVWILNEKMESMAYSVTKGDPLEAVTPRTLVGRVDKAPTFMEANSICAVERYVCRICRKNRVVGFLLVLGTEHKLDLTLDPAYVVDICSALSRWKAFRPDGARQVPVEEFVVNLVEERLTDPFMARQVMKQLGWPQRDRYYVLAIERTAHEQRFPLIDHIRALLQQGIYPYGGYYISILGCARDVNLKLEHFKPLVHFLRVNQMAMGLSNGYSDIVMTGEMFRQSVEAIRCRSMFTGKTTTFARYEDRMWSHLLNLAEEKGVHLMSLCTGSVLDVVNYDQNSGTEYFKTLATFLLNGMSFKATANLLYMHRNTTYKRICQIKEIFGIDFEDRWEVNKLQFSVLILGYLGIVDLKGLIEPEELARFQDEGDGEGERDTQSDSSSG